MSDIHNFAEHVSWYILKGSLVGCIRIMLNRVCISNVGNSYSEIISYALFGLVY